MRPALVCPAGRACENREIFFTPSEPGHHCQIVHCCFCWGVFVNVMSPRTWLSTEYSVNGWYISSQLCSDQKTSRFGEGFHLFFGELSYFPMPRILLPAGMCSGSASSY